MIFCLSILRRKTLKPGDPEFYHRKRLYFINLYNNFTVFCLKLKIKSSPKSNPLSIFFPSKKKQNFSPDSSRQEKVNTQKVTSSSALLFPTKEKWQKSFGTKFLWKNWENCFPQKFTNIVILRF